MTIYLFVLLIFWISQQGFYALLHPERQIKIKLNYKGVTNTKQDKDTWEQLEHLWISQLTLLLHLDKKMINNTCSDLI